MLLPKRPAVPSEQNFTSEVEFTPDLTHQGCGRGVISTTTAFSGGSSVSNWLCNSNGFMKWPVRLANRCRISSSAPRRYT